MKRVKPNLVGTLLIVMGVIVIVLAILFFAVEPKKNEQVIKSHKITEIL